LEGKKLKTIINYPLTLGQEQVYQRLNTQQTRRTVKTVVKKQESALKDSVVYH